MSTESPRNCTDLAGNPAAGDIAVRVGKQTAARVSVEIRYVEADEPLARVVARSTATESHPYSSFEQGGVRRFDRVPFARGPFDGTPDLPPFRIS
jgi:hypothetical protein